VNIAIKAPTDTEYA